MPARKGAQILEMRGERRKSALRQPAQADVGDLQAPADASELVREVWDTTVRALASTGLLRAADRGALRVFAEAVAVHQRVCAELAAAPSLVVVREGGRVGRHPGLLIQAQAGMQILSAARQLGLSPAARESLTIRGQDPAGDGKGRDPGRFLTGDPGRLLTH